MENSITFIEAKKDLKKLLRVCAYARVSNDKEEMLESLSNQVSHYNEFISSNPKWIYVGVYADEGISGTKLDRPEFNRMLDDARAGKIDLIITKSISRFARNTETVLKTIRELTSLGVDVYFEAQRMHTLSSDGEFMLTVLASYYQEEARSVSENMKWRIKKDFQEGILWGSNPCYGYDLIDKKFVLKPKEAEVVKHIFDLYINGMGIQGIANKLDEEGIKPMKKSKWGKSSIARILTNSNYTGDLVLQKTYSADYVTKVHKRNKGERDQYVVENAHEPIISRETFLRAQAIREERKQKHNKGEKSKNLYPLSGLLKCGICGKSYGHRITKYSNKWICDTFNFKGKSQCPSKCVPNAELERLTNEICKSKEYKKVIKKIVAFPNNTLVFHLLDGTTIERKWDDYSRTNSWTPEMKEKARQRALKQHDERRKNNG